MTADLNFNSQFADNLRHFILEKRGVGCKYKVEAATIRQFDEYVCSSGYEGMAISKELFEEWTNRRSYEREKTAKTGLIFSRSSASISSASVVRHIFRFHPSGFAGMYRTVRTFLRIRSCSVFWNAQKICPEVCSEKQSFICCSLY